MNRDNCNEAIERHKTYEVKFRFELLPGYAIEKIVKSLSLAITEEINMEFPEIAFVYLCDLRSINDEERTDANI